MTKTSRRAFLKAAGVTLSAFLWPSHLAGSNPFPQAEPAIMQYPG